MEQRRRNLVLVLILIAAVCLFVGLTLSRRETHAERVDFLMDTFVEQRITGPNAEKTGEKTYQALRDFDEALSLYNAESQISRINAAAGREPVVVEQMVYDLLKRARDLSEQSYGAFDFTIAPVTTLWHEAKIEGRPPEDDAVAKRLALVDYRRVRFDDAARSVMLEEAGMAIDLGGIAKGYACDIVRQIYRESGVSTALVSIGGNVYTYRAPKGEQTYHVGIRNPLGDSADPMMRLNITEEVIATSGAYERFFEYEGVSYHHILSTQTGQPAETDLLAAVAISPDGALADFLSTTFYVLGRDAVLEAIAQEEALLAQGEQPQFRVIAVDRDHKIYVSPSLRGQVELLEPEQFQIMELSGDEIKKITTD